MDEPGFCSCGNPLPVKKSKMGKPFKYCDTCRLKHNKDNHREAAVAYQRRTRAGGKRRKIIKPIRIHNPMLYLGLDYVTAKLAGLIRTPKGDGKQISLLDV
jgi:hypothetical protein